MKTNSMNKPRKLFGLYRGKIYLINPGFQYRFMAYVVISVIFSMAVMYAANIYFFETFTAKGVALDLPPDHPFFLIINEQKEFMSKVFLTASIIVSVGIGIWGLFFSHRIAGPLFRLHRYFKDAANNQSKAMEPIKFRKNDFFPEIPHAINEYFNSVHMNHHGKKESDKKAS